MRIVHVINYFQHQLGYQEYFLAKEHAKAGHEVTVITSNKYFPFPDYEKTTKPILGERVFEPRKEEIDRFRVIRLRGIFEQPGRRIWLVGLFRWLREMKPDLVICHGEYTYNTLVLSIYKKYLHYKLVVDSHYTEIKLSSNIKSKIVFKLYEKIVFSRKDIVFISTSSWNLKCLVQEYDLSETSLFLIPHGSDIDRFRPDDFNRRIWRENLKISDDEIVIVYTGKITTKKNPLIIIDAANKFRIKEKVKFLYIGSVEENYRKKYDNYIKTYSDIFIHIDTVENGLIQNYYQIADIACWPTESSMSAIDAMACGLPVIVVDELKDRLSNNNGIGIREGNIEDLGKALVKLVEDKTLRKEMGKRGRELVEREMSWEKVAKRFIDIACK